MTINAIKAKSTEELHDLEQWVVDRMAYNRECGRGNSGSDVHTLYMIEDELSSRMEI